MYLEIAIDNIFNYLVFIYLCLIVFYTFIYVYKLVIDCNFSNLKIIKILFNYSLWVIWILVTIAIVVYLNLFNFLTKTVMMFNDFNKQKKIIFS